MNPTREQILIDWMLEKFGINAEHHTSVHTITWRGYDIIVFGEVPDNSFAVVWDPQIFTMADPDVFEKLMLPVAIAIQAVRRETDYLNPMQMARWH